MTLATWRGVTGRNILTQDIKFTYNLMFECFEWPKETPITFLPLAYNGEVAKLT